MMNPFQVSTRKGTEDQGANSAVTPTEANIHNPHNETPKQNTTRDHKEQGQRSLDIHISHDAKNLTLVRRRK